ncbi:unnamed protein product [Sphagnum balticum]
MQATPISSASTLSCSTANCVTPTVTNMRIEANLDNGGFTVPLNMSEFNIGGDCNEGGFPLNLIRWTLMYNNNGTGNQAVRNSGQAVNQGQVADSQCINGRFLIYVNLGPVSGVDGGIDRTGLGGTPGSYSLNLTIYGGVSTNDPNVNNQTATSNVIFN